MTANKINQQQNDWSALWSSLGWDDQDDANQQTGIQERLHRRALQYARPVEEDDANRNTRTILSFQLGDETYGVDVMVVRGIRLISGVKITRVPGVPTFYRGVVNIRGKITSVLDLRSFFHMNADPSTGGRELVMVEANRLMIGLLADHVEGVMTLPVEDIEPLDDMVYAHGITRGRLIVLDIEALFGDERLIIGGEE